VSCDTLLHSHGLARAKEHATRVRNGENSKSHGIHSVLNFVRKIKTKTHDASLPASNTPHR
jgi:hypothetical protein